jgi:heme oxygenase (biliverdin-IX-beta and delta-forming)
LSVLSADADERQVAPVNARVRPILDELRLATRDVHDRLHRHTGFAALQDQTITKASYGALLARLYGFYQPFESTAQIVPTRTRWLESDLSTLGVTKEQVARLPHCRAMPALTYSEQITGSLYVVEGSALGGRVLASRLDRLLGAGAVGGRRFFIGHGSDTGALWRGFLADLALLPSDLTTRGRCVAAATETFEAFESWLTGWEDVIS